VAFYNGDPQAGGKLLGSTDCPNVAGQGFAEATYNLKLPEGTYRIFSVVDNEDQISEDLEINNTASVELTVEKRIDLAINYNNITFSNDAPLESDRLIIYATVTNKREETVRNVPVAFYLVGSDGNGQFLGKVSLNQISGNSTSLAAFEWNTTGISGRQVIYVVVDPDNTIKEVDKSNNRAVQVIYIIARPDLAGTVSAPAMTEGNPVNITITIKNQGGSPAANVKVSFFSGEPELGKHLCNDVVIPNVAVGSSQNISVTMDTINRAGTQKVSVLIDPENQINESNESNNKLSAAFAVDPPAELEITDLLSSSAPISEGDQVTFRAIVKNTTSSRAQDVVIRFYKKDGNEWSVLSEQKGTIEGNQQKAFDVLWDSDHQLGTHS
jgi:subtilase family serine protease